MPSSSNSAERNRLVQELHDWGGVGSRQRKKGARPCLMNRDGGAERLIWRRIRHLISCTMTCAGGISAKRPLTRYRPTKSGKAKSRRAVASRRKLTAATA